MATRELAEVFLQRRLGVLPRRKVLEQGNCRLGSAGFRQQMASREGVVAGEGIMKALYIDTSVDVFITELRYS